MSLTVFDCYRLLPLTWSAPPLTANLRFNARLFCHSGVRRGSFFRRRWPVIALFVHSLAQRPFLCGSLVVRPGLCVGARARPVVDPRCTHTHTHLCASLFAPSLLLLLLVVYASDKRERAKKGERRVGRAPPHPERPDTELK